MTHSLKAVLAGGLVLLALAVGAGVSVAETLTFEPGGSIAFTGRLVATEAFGTRITCNTTLTGVLERSVSTTPGSRMGTISSGTTAECVNGRITTLPPTLWALVRVLEVSTTVTGILTALETFGVLVERGENQCLYSGTLGLLIRVNAERITAEVTTLEAEYSLIRTLRGFCPSFGRLGGTFALSPTQRVNRI
jgi:hypothetical protein